MEAIRYKETLYGQFALIAKALASPKRLEILELLSQGERTVEDLAAQTGGSVSSVSQHLQILRHARLLESRKDGLYVHYHIADDSVVDVLRAIRTLAVNRLGELREFLRDHVDKRDELTPLPHDELLKRARRGDIVVLDVRPDVEYRSGHIPAALSIPVPELERRLGELPRDKEIVAYCRGPYCVMSLDAIHLLRRHGFKARRLEDGFPEWKSGGHPVEAMETNSQVKYSKAAPRTRRGKRASA